MTVRSRTRQPPVVPENPEVMNDPFLLFAGTNQGNHYRRKRAIIRLEQMNMENSAKIRELRLENSKLRSTLARLRKQAEQTGRIELRFEQLSSIIMESQFMESQTQPNDESDSL
jgi:predicted RNase H-like nuclease (RuvC/YqgF family)